jgi:hypothetical protein
MEGAQSALTAERFEEVREAVVTTEIAIFYYNYCL